MTRQSETWYLQIDTDILDRFPSRISQVPALWRVQRDDALVGKAVNVKFAMAACPSV